MGCSASKTLDENVPAPLSSLKENADGNGNPSPFSENSVFPNRMVPLNTVTVASTNDSLILTSESSVTLGTFDTLYDLQHFDFEAARAAALHSCGVFDAAGEGRFDVITELASKLLDVPVALVSLVDNDKIWLKSAYGRGYEVGIYNREGSFCSYVTVPDFAEMLIVEDATKDARFSQNPYVIGPPELRFYAGCPLVASNGQRMGTLCLIDFRPRHFSSNAYSVLGNLAELVVREMEREKDDSSAAADSITKDRKSPSLGSVVDANTFRTSRESDCSATATMRRALPAAYEPVVLIDVSQPSWPIVYANQAWADMLEMEVGDVTEMSFWDIFESPTRDTDVAKVQNEVDTGQPATLLTFVRGGSGLQQAVCRVQFWLASRDQLKNAAYVTIPAYIPAEVEGEKVAGALVPLGALWIGTARILHGTPYASGAASENGGYPTFARRSALDLHALHKPQKLGGLTLGPLIGQGSFGKVYRGEVGNKSVAIKVLEVPVVAVTEQSMVERSMSIQESDAFSVGGGSSSTASSGGSAGGKMTVHQAMLEAALSRHLAHPNIVPTLDYITTASYDGLSPTQQVWIIQHLCDGGSLYDYIERGKLRESPTLSSPPSFFTVLATARDIASALQYLHEEGIIHGDLSGNNVLMSSANNARGFVALVSDFGLSRALPAEIHTQTVGTVTHMPPELLMDGTLTKAADVFAFGVILCEMWSGKRAWAGAAIGNIIYQVTCQDKKIGIADDCPAPVKELALQCMDTDRHKRPQFDEIVQRIDSMIKTELNCS